MSRQKVPAIIRSQKPIRVEYNGVMGTDARERSSSVEGDDRFATTHWSLVVAAGKRQEPNGEAALAALCETYWYPLYAYLRRRGYDAPDAQDLTQGFFAKLLEKDYLDDADQQRGRFRSFLITALKRLAEPNPTA